MAVTWCDHNAMINITERDGIEDPHSSVLLRSKTEFEIRNLPPRPQTHRLHTPKEMHCEVHTPPSKGTHSAITPHTPFFLQAHCNAHDEHRATMWKFNRCDKHTKNRLHAGSLAHAQSMQMSLWGPTGGFETGCRPTGTCRLCNPAHLLVP
jgi:hypothetical protein